MPDAVMQRWRGADGGVETCWFAPFAGRLAGMAVWPEEAGAGAAGYEIAIDPAGRTLGATVLADGLHLEIRCRGGEWTLGGVPVPEVRGALDIDLGFTPSTNTLPIRRLGLMVGQSADLVAAWLDPDDWRLKPLAQRYTRLATDRWEYLSRDGGFRAELTVTPEGIVRDYGHLWKELRPHAA